MSSRSLNDLHPIVQRRASEFLQACERAGDGLETVLIYCTYRDLREQAALYSQGREPLERVNALRRLAKLPEISDRENHRTVTNAKPGQSPHNYELDRKPASLAFDACPAPGGKFEWGNIRLLNRMADIAESVGLISGRGFSTVKGDLYHCELSRKELL